jgi:uncharacterized protein YjdB
MATFIGISVTPLTLALVNGHTQQMSASAVYDDMSQIDITSHASWNSSNSGSMTVNSAGLVTAVATGAAVIRALSGALEGFVSGSCSAGSLVSLTVLPTGSNKLRGSTTQMNVSGTYQDSSYVDMAGKCNWTSSDTAVFTVNASTGVVTAVQTGSANVLAASGSITGSTSFAVHNALTGVTINPVTSSILPLGSTQQLLVSGTFEDTTHDYLPAAKWTWTSSDVTYATVAATGIVTTVRSGSATVTATSGAFTASSLILINSGTLSSLSVTPSSLNVVNGKTGALTVAGTYSDGMVRDLTTTAAWTTGTGGVATVGAHTGVVTGVADGVATITATIGSKTSTCAVTSSMGNIVSIGVGPTPRHIYQGTTLQLSASALYEDGTYVVATTTGDWSSSNAARASVGANTGLVTAVAGGPDAVTTVYVTTGSMTGSAEVNVDRHINNYSIVKDLQFASASFTKVTFGFTADSVSFRNMSNINAEISWDGYTVNGGTVVATGSLSMWPIQRNSVWLTCPAASSSAGSINVEVYACSWLP